MKTVLHMGAGLLRALFAVAVGLVALFSLFLGGAGRTERRDGRWSHATEGDRALLETGHIREHERDALGNPRYPEPGDSDY